MIMYNAALTLYFVVPSEEDKERMLLGVKNLDRNLGPYPFQAWSKWVTLSSRLRSHHPLFRWRNF